MFNVSSAALTTDLTTTDAVKARLSITGADEDTYLAAQIVSASAAICAYLNVAPASNGTRNLARETLVETLRPRESAMGVVMGSWPLYYARRRELVLSRYPVTSITSIVEDGDTLAATDYELDGATGVLRRLTADDFPCDWISNKIVVTYVAGWLLPNDTGRTLPQDIEDAAIALVKTARAARTRDPLLRGENILSGLYSYTLFSPTELAGSMPPEVATLLDRYRNMTA